MKFLALSLVCVVFSLALVEATPSYRSELAYENMFGTFMHKYNKQYDSANETFYRFNVFKTNVDFMDAHNAKRSSYTLGMNAFGDLTSNEFREKYLTGKPQFPSEHVELHSHPNLKDLPTTWDWTTKGAVLPIYNQGQANAVELFVVTDTVASAWEIKNPGKLYHLSMNELSDCVSNQSSMEDYYRFVQENGLCGGDYPSNSTICNQNQCQSVAHISGTKSVAQGDEDALMTAVYTGVVAVAIEADQQSFQFYSGGIFNDKSCGKNVDHEMSIVGWGTSGGVGYWKLRNSWGVSWGLNGYILMARGSDICGLADYALYPYI